MNILLLGAGGRESAIAWKLAQSPSCSNLYIAPGNGGTAQYGTNLAIKPTDFEAVKSACTEYKIDVLFPGNEDPLVAGIRDFFKNDEALKHIIVAGPSQAGAQLEGSKAFSKKFMQRHTIPTAAYREFSKENFEEGLAYLRDCNLPIVLKADGLAAGKGVIIAESAEEAIDVYKSMIQEAQFGAAGEHLVVEEFLTGIELSVFILTDGEHYVLLPEAKDYKRIFEGDAGPNTGGMGAVSPVPFANEIFMQKVKTHIIDPTINGLKNEQIIYHGFLFFGLINVAGEPFVIEYNCRLGDPETEVVMPRLENDLVLLIQKMGEGKLNEVELKHSPSAACTIMLVSEGYPGDYQKGITIHGIDEVKESLVFQAGTAVNGDDVVTAGGRVMAITSTAKTLNEALRHSYENAAKIYYEGKYYRRDIGFEFLETGIGE